MNSLEQTTCKCCGRKLRKGETVKLGMGKKCFEKYLKGLNRKKLFNMNKEE